jgi:hypothetical protein
MDGHRIRFAEANLTSLDGLAADALALFVGTADRPLLGVPGLIDWRLCGVLSRTILGGHLEGELEEVLLMPSGGRIPPRALFCFGVGQVPLSTTRFAQVAKNACQVMGRAQVAMFAAEMPEMAGGDLQETAEAWLEATGDFAGKGQVILGDAKALHRAFTAAKKSVHSSVVLDPPVTRVDLPPRGGPAFSVKPAVVR